MISAIENAMIGRINATALGYKLRKVATYAGEFEEAIGNLVRDFPAVLLAFNGANLTKEGRLDFEMKGTFSVICCATSLRNEKTSRHGSDGKVGSYQIIQDMLALFNGQTLGLEITPLVARSIQPLMNDLSGTQLASVYSINFETSFVLTPANTAELGDFETWAPAWDIPLHGNVTPPLPAENADARDLVTLPIQEPIDD